MKSSLITWLYTPATNLSTDNLHKFLVDLRMMQAISRSLFGLHRSIHHDTIHPYMVSEISIYVQYIIKIS